MKNLEMVIDKKANELEELFNKEFPGMEMMSESYESGEDYTVWFSIDRGCMEIHICLDKDGFALETQRRTDDEPKNIKTVKGVKAVINYIDRVLN